MAIIKFNFISQKKWTLSHTQVLDFTESGCHAHLNYYNDLVTKEGVKGENVGTRDWASQLYIQGCCALLLWPDWNPSQRQADVIKGVLPCPSPICTPWDLLVVVQRHTLSVETPYL